MAFNKSKVDQTISRKKSLPENETLHSQNAGPYVTSQIRFIISNNYDGELLQMISHA